MFLQIYVITDCFLFMIQIKRDRLLSVSTAVTEHQNSVRHCLKGDRQIITI